VLNDLVTIKTRVLNGQEWSALNEATFIVGDPALVVNELHYHPANPTDAERIAGFDNADDFEFIELANPGTGTYDLNGLRIISGVHFDFTGSSITNLPAGRFVLIVKNRAAFELRYGAGLPVAGEYSGQLDNAGERLQIVNGHGESILDFTYGTRLPWPEAAAGTGSSLELADRQGDFNSPANWRSSTVSGGSPGQPNPVPPPVLGNINPSEGQLRFRFAGTPGAGYSIYVRDSLSTGAWQLLQQVNPLSPNQPIESTVPLTTNLPSQFFRISIP
jgi:hypothetical protein